MMCFHITSVFHVELKKPGGPLVERWTIYGSHTWSGGTIYGSKIVIDDPGATYGRGTIAV